MKEAAVRFWDGLVLEVSTIGFLVAVVVTPFVVGVALGWAAWAVWG